MKCNTILYFLIICCTTAGFTQEHQLDSFDENQPDTLFFYYDADYLEKQFKHESNYLFVKDTGDDSGYFFFEKINEYNNLCPKVILNLRKYIRKSGFYDANKKIKLDDYGLYNYLKNSIIFLVKSKRGKKQFLLVKPWMVIE